MKVRKLIKTLLLSCFFIILSIFILSTLSNKNQRTELTEHVKTIELKNNLNIVPKYFKKIDFKYDNDYYYIDATWGDLVNSDFETVNYDYLMFELNEKLLSYN